MIKGCSRSKTGHKKTLRKEVSRKIHFLVEEMMNIIITKKKVALLKLEIKPSF